MRAIALDTTGSSVVPVGQGLVPLDDYYLWCDHRAWQEAALITGSAHERGLEAIDWCGGAYSSEWGFSKLLHWLRHNPGKRDRFVTALEHCDMVAATLCGITEPSQVKRSVCAMGHKWMWNESLGGLPPEDFLVAVDPLLAGVRDKLAGLLRRRRTSSPGGCRAEWAARLGLRPGIPIPVGRLRRALGRDWRRRAAGRHGERHRDVHLHHRRQRAGRVRSRRLRRGARVRGPPAHGHRGGPLGDRRHLRCHRPAGGHDGCRPVRRTRALPRRRDGPAAPDLGQRRPHGAGESRAWRRDLGLEPHAHGAGRPVRRHRGHGVPHARHPRAHGGARRPDRPRDQRRGHPEEEPGAQRGLRQRH